jgi:hypothetical protein
MRHWRTVAAILGLLIAPWPAARGADSAPPDEAVEAAAKLRIGMPVMGREWHVWWGLPHG